MDVGPEVRQFHVIIYSRNTRFLPHLRYYSQTTTFLIAGAFASPNNLHIDLGDKDFDFRMTENL